MHGSIAPRITIVLLGMMLSLLPLSQSCKAPNEGDIPRQKELLSDGNWHKLDSLKETTIWSLAASPSVLIAGARAEAGAFRSLDNGITWQPTLLQNRAIRPLLVNGNVILAGINDGRMMRSTDNGATWQEANTNGLKFFSTDIVALGNTVLAGGHYYSGGSVSANRDDNIIVRSTDNGLTWTMVYNLGLPVTSYISFASIGNIIFAATPNRSGGRMIWSRDNGISWQEITSTTPLWFVPRLAANRTVLLNAGSKIYRSLDNGTTWQEIPFALTEGEISCVLAVGDSSFFVGTSREGVYRSDDNGATWKPFNPGLTIKGVTTLVAQGNYLFASADGDGVYRLRLR